MFRRPDGLNGAAGDPAHAPPVHWEGRFALAERAVEQFRVDAERYFGGGLELPPEDLRDRIAAQLRELRSLNVRSVADRYRFTALEARFNALSELFNRRLREREEGRGVVRRPAVVEVDAPRYDATAGVVLGDRPDPAAIETLWRSLVATGGRKLELDTFRGYLVRQIDQVRAKTGAASVQFRVAEENGELKLKAKPLAPGETG